MVKTAVAALAATLLSACMDQTALTTETPDAQTSGESAFAILDEGDEGQLIVEAEGRRVDIAPPSGLCVDPASVREQGEALFVLIGACEQSEAAPVAAFSLGRSSLFGSDRKAAFEALEKLLATDAGRKSAGMGGEAHEIAILETRRTDTALFAL
jgi:hypothetical protein